MSHGWNYYNEHDPKAAAWLRELIRGGHIAPGDVDERSIADVWPTDLAGYSQCHFFAGIGGWSRALRLAGWPDSKPVWTGSCPCQPFSCAGQGKGEADERHLWPEFKRLIEACQPATVFGEQVASKLGRDWLAGVFADLERMAYQRAGADLCAAGVGAPHIRQRLFWMADADQDRRGSGSGIGRGQESPWSQDGHDLERCGGDGGVANMPGEGRFPGSHPGIHRGEESTWSRDGEPERRGATGRLAHPALPKGSRFGQLCQHLPGSSAWSNFDLIPCADGKTRRIESGTFPLVARLPSGVVPSGDPSVQEAQATAEGRVARLRGYGNSIVPEVAAEFIRAYIETGEELTP